MLYLCEEEIAEILTMREAIEAVEKAFGEYARGSAIMPSRSTMMLDKYNGSVSLMPSYLEETGALATKIISIYPENPRKGLPTTMASIVVNDPETGRISAILDGTYLTSVRTGAASGVAARYLAPRDSRVAAVIGCGAQGMTQAWAMAETFNLDQIRIFDIFKEGMDRFVNEMVSRLGVDIIKAGSSKEAVKGADIVLTATTSKEPVIQRAWLEDRVHVGAFGSFYPDSRELDTATIVEGKVVVDSMEAMMDEAGDLLIPISEGAITADHIHAELGAVVNGEKEGRTKSDSLTVFKSVGMAIQDSSVASLVLRKYKESH
ncbi:MAG: ornithine cyclodeaminase family protein [Candidatus Bathyarchaeota archaeon]|jgi:ornithine cyclodeaminase/alanine dehydrogenase|nr:ornithine cyclodeaminase family protein [Candidatus Bathyarchaeota archaeon]